MTDEPINLEELGRLNNWCQTMLMLEQKVEYGTYRAAVKAAEIAGLLHGGDAEFDVVFPDEVK
jgi:hypothetical protein